MTETPAGNEGCIELEAHTLKVQQLNDQFRQTLMGGQILLTSGIQALTPEQQSRALQAISGFDNFNEDNDSYGFHDFGEVKIDNIKIWFKIDCYDKSLKFGSPDPSNPAVTTRVMTILLPEEY